MSVYPALVHVNSFSARVDHPTKCLIIEVRSGDVDGTPINLDHSLTLSFGPHTTWLLGEMVQALKNDSSLGFGLEPGLQVRPRKK